MFGRGEDQQSPNGGITTADEPIGALGERLPADETVVHRLDGSGALVHEADDGDHSQSAEAALVAATDRRLHFAATTESGTGVQTVPYCDVRSVSYHDGLIRSRIAVRVWNDGTYRLPAGRGQDVTAAAEFIERASETFQRVTAALEDAREQITELGQHVEAGDDEAVRGAHESVREALSLAGTRIDAGPDEIEGVLRDRVREVATELQRTRVRAHVARGSTLVDEGDRLTDREAWDDAVSAYVGAREHFETALEVSRAQEFGLADAIRTEAQRLQRRIDALAKLPLRRAEEARAVATDAEDAGDVEAAVPAWAAALEHYRAALTAGWGEPIEFAGDDAVLRRQVESAAARLVEARCELATRLRRTGDDHRMSGADDVAGDCYEAALSQLEAADRLARELRAGDRDAIAAQRDTVRDRLAAAVSASASDQAADADRADGRTAVAEDRQTPLEPGQT